MTDFEAITEAISALASMECHHREYVDRYLRNGEKSHAASNWEYSNRYGMALACLHRMRAEMIDQQRAALAGEQSALACRSAAAAKSPSDPAAPA
jgi:hypothetical protein